MRMLLFLLLFSFPAFAEMPEVIDGDTLRGQEGERLRIAGIDAPEMDQICVKGGEPYFCGVEAKETLIWILSEGDQLVCKHHPNRRDRYGRALTICGIDDKDVAWLMVRFGWALAYRKYSTYYVEAEEMAKSDGVGMWAGDFIPPWEWRATH